MYGAKPPVVAGISLLPATGDSLPLLIAAVSLIAGGLAILVIGRVMARKAGSKAN